MEYHFNITNPIRSPIINPTIIGFAHAFIKPIMTGAVDNIKDAIIAIAINGIAIIIHKINTPTTKDPLTAIKRIANNMMIKDMINSVSQLKNFIMLPSF